MIEINYYALILLMLISIILLLCKIVYLHLSPCIFPLIIRARAHWPLCLATGGRVFVAGIFIPVGNSSFSEHTAVCGSSVRQAVARPRYRQSVFVAVFGSEHTSDCSCGMWQPLSRVGNFAEYENFAGG